MEKFAGLLLAAVLLIALVLTANAEDAAAQSETETAAQTEVDDGSAKPGIDVPPPASGFKVQYSL